jgi:FkbM family methyltransferase
MISRFLQRAVSAIPWRLRGTIKHIPLIAPLQRWLLENYLAGEEFVHRVDAGPARGLIYPVSLPQDKGVWTGTYETDFATALAGAVPPDGTCLDVGGWHGFYSGVMALAGASKVIVFEPLPANCQRIRRLIELNPPLPIELIQAAVADRAGATEFQVMGQESMGKLAESPFQTDKRSSQQITVQLVSLDEMLAQGRISAPSLIKVDVEGGELLVLRGAAQLLRDHHPILFMELHSPELAGDCRQFLEELGYEIELLEEEGAIDPAICHFLAQPRERPIARHQASSDDGNRMPGFDIPILLYHHLVAGNDVNPAAYEMSIGQFEQQLDLLEEWGFTPISFAKLLRIMVGLEPPKKRSVIITFDDAFRSFYKLALPALERRHMEATVFVPAGEIGGTNRWDAANGYAPRSLMTEVELREINAAGMEIGSHGWAHRSLPGCSELEAREELVRSREHLGALGLTADIFAYPYGQHSPRCIAMVKAAGYRAAASIFSDAPSVTANRFVMRRIYVHPGDTPLRFRSKLSRLYLRYKAMRGAPPEFNAP